MTEFDIASQKLVPIDKKVINISEIEFDDLSIENLEDIKKEIDCVIQFRKLLNEGKVSLCRKYINSKNKIKDTFEKDRLILQQQHDNLMLQLRTKVEILKKKNIKKDKEVEIYDEDEVILSDEDEEIEELPKSIKKKTPVKIISKKVTNNTKKGK